MRFLYRPVRPEPRVFQSKRVTAARQAARVFFSRRADSRVQERHSFDTALWARFAPDVLRFFDGKCAYCESALSSPSSGNLDQFRPAAEFVGADGKADGDGYWWLAYEWSNLYAACETCRKNKHTQFPIAGSRARPGLRGPRLALEKPLLLDPCRDNPMQHLRFERDGTVVHSPMGPETSGLPTANRGQTTITVFGLNRPELVAARQQVSAKLFVTLEIATKDGAFGDAADALLSELYDLTSPHAGMRRQLLRFWTIPEFESGSRRTRAALVRLVRQATQPQFPGASRRKQTQSKVRHKSPARHAPRVLASAGAIQSITIENFRAIRELTLNISSGSTDRFGWQMLLGENGTGKSSILQAIALALLGPAQAADQIQRAGVKPAGLLRRYHGNRTTRTGRVNVKFTTGAEADLRILPRRLEFKSRAPPGIFMRGFGATRYLPRRPARSLRAAMTRRQQVDSLFDPAAATIDPDSWLANIPSTLTRGRAALSLKDLLNIAGRERIALRGGRILVPMNGTMHTLRELSAGFESVIVMVTSIMAGVIDVVRDMRTATGVVLIDEIDAHLHPRWKMRIVDSLRRAFPALQFIVTTHEPLCLRGIEKDEVCVLERIDNQVFPLEDVPSPKTMRIDQLLTSNLFGLGSTLDPEIDTAMNRYYELLALPESKLTTRLKSELVALRGRIKPYESRLLADDPRSELVNEAVDGFLAKERTLRGPDRTALRELRSETKQLIASLYDTKSSQRRRRR
jgi:uncharacterized protein (TIGR02646 family)